MPELPSLPASLCCPGCGGALIACTVERLECSDCKSVHPVFDGLPWLYRDVASSRSQWASKLQRLRDEITGELASLDRTLAAGVPLASTRDRLGRLRAGHERLGRQLFGLLEPFAFSASEASARLPRDRIPSRQHFASYLDTVFRDWSWGEEEVQATRERIEPLLGGGPAGRRVLILGGGAGRLGYELARLPDWDSVVQLDINPLLSRIAALLARGESLTLTEIPRMPAGLAHVAVDQALVRPEPAPASPLHFLIGDLFTPPFAPGSFDLLLTPWLVDILPESFDRVARRLNALLAPGASWISFGPLSFESVSEEGRYTPEEMEEALDAAGLDVERSELWRAPYLHSPHGLPRRSEQIMVFRALRREGVPRAEQDPFALYPGWMTDPEQPVPQSPRFAQMRLDRVFEAEILACVDGRASIREIIDALSTRYGLPRERCENAVNRFFAKAWEMDTDPEARA